MGFSVGRVRDPNTDYTSSTIKDLKRERKLRREKTFKTIYLLRDVNKFIKSGLRFDDELFSLQKIICFANNRVER